VNVHINYIDTTGEARHATAFGRQEVGIAVANVASGYHATHDAGFEDCGTSICGTDTYTTRPK